MNCCNCCSCGHDQPCVSKVPIFSSLGPEELMQVASMITHREYRKGETIFEQGDAPDSLIIVNQGSAKAFRYTPGGQEQILYIFDEGSFFGEQYLFSSQIATYHVQALEPLKVCMLSKADFDQLLYRYPDIAVKVIQELGKRMARLENALQSIGVRNLDARIGGLLLDFAEKYGSQTPEGTLVKLPLNREGMANYLGIARETFSRKMGQLESQGLIRSVDNKSILLTDLEALRELA